MKRVFCLYRVSTKKQVDINGELTVMFVMISRAVKQIGEL